ncbi:hypothetical protein G6L97_00740 [Agrobacterium tumefaciens]|uniref:hypothetical protein n=1 Tax=Agrobacterium tumefaciens TaxID=358 RepID=UPI001572B5A8|nr:hypothetical protein [Agrobacterium tumefaciens]NSZ82933.1 hypothetical protein [Agrobacterium tumefaciens]WCA69166.1 hypothetical protein G6L97_00740 [Agrobacterium tumefaciens]
MKYHPPYGAVDPNASYVDKNVPGAVRGSAVPAAAIENPQRELVNLITKSGLFPDDELQLSTAVDLAIQGGKPSFAVAAGTANNLSVSLSPEPPSLVVGMVVRIKITANNSGAATLNVNGLGAVPIITLLGSALSRGDLPSGAVMSLVYTGTAWMLAGLAYSEIPIIGTRTIWVRTDGNDNNSGEANNAGSALATIAEAFNRIKGAGSSATITIRLGNPGTYAAPGVLGSFSGDVTILGDLASQGSYIISGVAAPAIVGMNASAILRVYGVEVRNTGTALDNIRCVNGLMYLKNCTMSIPSGSSGRHMYCVDLGYIAIDGGCIISGNADSAIYAYNGGKVQGTAALAVSGTPNFATAFARVAILGIINNNGSFSVTGSATGVRYSGVLNGVINTGGGGANFFPGNAAGATGTGAQYS